MPRYAERTTVSSEASRAEVERTLKRYGASGFGYAYDEDAAGVVFKIHGRQVRFLLPLPDPADEEFTHYRHSSGHLLPRGRDGATAAHEKATRQRWRALALCIKAKLEAVESGIVDFESEFLANIVLPDGGTVGSWMRPQVEKAYRTGLMPPLLPALPAPGGER